MTRAAADWSEHNPDRRFARGEPYDELSSLAATLDTLLTRLGNSLRNEQRFSSEMSHELRTPLARIHAEVELALRRERQLRGTARSARGDRAQREPRWRRTIDALVAVARYEGAAMRGASDAREAIEHAIDARARPRGQQGHRAAGDAPQVESASGPTRGRRANPRAADRERLPPRTRSSVVVTVARDGHVRR